MTTNDLKILACFSNTLQDWTCTSFFMRDMTTFTSPFILLQSQIPWKYMCESEWSNVDVPQIHFVPQLIDK